MRGTAGDTGEREFLGAGTGSIVADSCCCWPGLARQPGSLFVRKHMDGPLSIVFDGNVAGHACTQPVEVRLLLTRAPVLQSLFPALLQCRSPKCISKLGLSLSSVSHICFPLRPAPSSFLPSNADTTSTLEAPSNTSAARCLCISAAVWRASRAGHHWASPHSLVSSAAVTERMVLPAQ